MKTTEITNRMKHNFAWVLTSLVFSVLLSLNCISFAAENTWTRKADMPTARAYSSSAVVAGKIYVIGGLSYAPVRVFRTVEVYDPTNNTWTKKADMPTERFAPSASVVDGKIYVLGGASWQGNAVSTVEVYNPDTDTWTTKTSMPKPRGWFHSAVIDGKIYAIGGSPRVNTTALKTVEVYDTVTDTWERKTDMPTPRDGAAVAVNGIIYVPGGWKSPAEIIGTVEAYNPSTPR